MRVANIKEWIGKTDDSRPPPHVILRIFERAGGVCHISKLKIQPGQKWHVEHVKAICLGGENRESNMAPALVEPHKAKTAEDRRIKRKNDHVRMAYLGVRKTAGGRALPGTRASGIRKRMNGQVERW